MKIKNILLYIPRSLYSSLAKMVKTDITEKVKDKIMADGMYHFTPSEAVVFEGYCILPHNQVEKVKMVPDLVRDEKGRPLKDEKGNLQVAFREATEEELIPNTNEYKAKEDYLNYMLEKAKEYGYSDRSKVLNGINNFIDQTKMENMDKNILVE